MPGIIFDQQEFMLGFASSRFSRCELDESFAPGKMIAPYQARRLPGLVSFA